MKKLNFEFSYASVQDLENLSEEDRMLVNACKDAAQNAHAPYSQFKVGAALLLENQALITGSNQENAAFPSGLCAERVAMFHAAHSHPGVAGIALAVVAFDKGKITDNPVTPCGGCRQVMSEFVGKASTKMRLLLVGEKEVLIFEDALSLLPFHFS